MPVGTPDPEVSVTFTVKVTDVPETALVVEACSVVDVGASVGAVAFTVRVTADEVLVLKLESPP